jgi:DhnA family fructose-bisphosphate aldolase class Ia
LSCYDADSAGTLTNLARLLNHGRLAGTGKQVILPVDQGLEHGPARSFAPNPPAYSPHCHFELIIEAGCNAYAAPLSFLEAGARDFAGKIPLILKTNDKLLEIRSIHAGGGFGSITGRNSFQRPKDEALRLLEAVMDIYATAPDRDRTR